MTYTFSDDELRSIFEARQEARTDGAGRSKLT